MRDVVLAQVRMLVLESCRIDAATARSRERPAAACSASIALFASVAGRCSAAAACPAHRCCDMLQDADRIRASEAVVDQGLGRQLTGARGHKGQRRQH